MDPSHSESPKSEEVFQFSPLKSKIQQVKPQLRLCQVKFLKCSKTPSPSQTNFKTSAFPRVYQGSYLDSKLSIKSSPVKHSQKSSKGFKSKRSHIFTISKSPSINHSKDITLQKSHKKIREDSFIINLLHLCQLKSPQRKLQLEKS
jgi:hypothetical protein